MQLRMARFLYGLTQIELESKSGVCQTRISHFERGHAKPNKNEKIKIESVLGPINWAGTRRKRTRFPNQRKEG
jgi:transcriptional regulator with XRE-family HTH domain